MGDTHGQRAALRGLYVLAGIVLTVFLGWAVISLWFQLPFER